MVRLRDERVVLNGKQVVGAASNLVCHSVVWF